ncbi:MAG TPA: DNA polymerase, partial [Planctomycetota bacterium]|nr:DNA polymerase [Planctomycetota bacterium]
VRCDCDLAEALAGWPEAAAWGGLEWRPIERERLLDFYTYHGFREARRALEEQGGTAAPSAGTSGAAVGAGEAPAGPPITEKHYETVLTREAFDAWLERLQAAELAALDTETDSLDPMRARIVGLSFSVEPGAACYIPLAHTYPGAPDQLPLEEVLAALRPWLEDETRAKVGQHVKYDQHVFLNHGIEVRGYRHDTMLQSYVFEAHKPHNLESLASRHLNRTGLTYEQVCGKGAQQIPFAQVELTRATEYSGEDSDMTLHVHRVLWPRLEAEPGLRRVYEEIEMPASQTLLRMERNGVLIDAGRLARQSQELAARMVGLEQEAHALAGQPFNLGSPKQICEILFNKMGLPVRKKTASGVPSTDEDVLTELAADYPLPAKLLEHRALSKLKGTYTDKLP